MNNYIIEICCALIVYIFYSIITDTITSVRLRKGIINKISIHITDNETTITDNIGTEILREPTIVNYTIHKRGRVRILNIGDPNYIYNLDSNSHAFRILQSNFIEDYETEMTRIDDFWYQYLTYYSLRSKKISRISSFAIVAVSISIEVTSHSIGDKIKLELQKSIQTIRPKLFNIVEIKMRE